MTRHKKIHRDNLPQLLKHYADSRYLSYHRYSPFHLRLIDQGTATLDCWTTGKYYVLGTNYAGKAIERGGEKGILPGDTELEAWLDGLFYAAEIETPNETERR